MRKLWASTALFALLGLLPNQGLSQTYVSGTVPHYAEFDATENPNRYFWCGHAALKSVGKYIAGTLKTLGSLHSTFKANSPRGYATNTYCLTDNDWCASLQDLYWAALYSKNGGYGRSNTVLRSIQRGTGTSLNYDAFYTQIKGGVNANYPGIIASSWWYGDAGHFFIVTGYKDGADAKSSYLYLRDTALSVPKYTKYDRSVTVKTFFGQTVNSGNTIQILYVK